LLCNVFAYDVFLDFSKAVSSVANFVMSANFEISWGTNEDEKAMLRARHGNERLYQGPLKTLDATAKSEVKLTVRD
jgi:hypothetical protein